MGARLSYLRIIIATNKDKSMKRLLLSLTVLTAALSMQAQQGWPSGYGDVMLQGFSWDSYQQTKWIVLQSQADELSEYFKLVWIPQSGSCKGQSMGYDDYWWFPGNNNYSSSFGNETELRSMINTFKDKGIGTIADVVINHRKNRSTMVDFPTETYNGVTYKLLSTDICKYDDKYQDKTGKWIYPTLEWANNNNATISSNRDTGEDWPGMRDLDHKSENVQTTVKAYLKMLLNDLGYAGFRYDMVKGYGAAYTKMYNEDSQPTYSVGECWDGTSVIKTWIDGTGKTSAAFDFQFKYVVRNATENGNWSLLAEKNDGNWPLISNNEDNGSYRQWAVTFVENHDTQLRPDGTSNGPLSKDTLAANAYMMGMPGTPCVFQPHWIDCKPYIKAMIDVRHLAGIKNTSSYENLLANNTKCFAVKTDNRLITVLGDVSQYTPESGWVKIIDGYHYAYYVPSNIANKAWISHVSGDYENEQQVLLTALGNNNAKLVYTTDGTNPTPSSTQVNSGTKVTIPVGTTTLKVALLVGGQISGSIETRTYEIVKVEPFSIPDFCTVAEGEVCAFFEAPATWTSTIKIWAWDVNSSNVNYTGGTWPGVACKKLGKDNRGKFVWKWTFSESDYKGTAGTAKMPSHIIFNNDGSAQTDNLIFKNGGFYDQTGLLGTVTTDIHITTFDKAAKTQRIYTLDGRYVGTDFSALSRGLYIVNGRKIMK